MAQRNPILHRRRQAARSLPGSRPGEFVISAESPPPKIQAFSYSSDSLEEREITDLAALEPLLETSTVTWVNVDGLGDADVLRGLGDLFGIHPLALEDAVNVPQRTKVETYDDQLFIVLHTLSLDHSLENEQISIFVGPGFVLTLQERPGDPLEPVRERLRSGRGRIRESGPDYLAYALIDAVLDFYFPVLEQFQDSLILLQDDLRTPRPDALERIHSARSELVEIRRAVGPMRELTRSLMVGDWPELAESTRVYLRDCHDHAIAAAELMETALEMASGLMDIHLSTVSHQVNDTMKVLSVFATIFMPLSFIAGLYGMNFNPELPGNMPELDWPYGYVMVLGGMALLGGGLLVYFRKKDWF